jgi:beta-galactosidase
MAERFGDSQHVVGWQIDNEYNRVCYCEHCRELFRRYLAETYGSLEHLNARWTTRYWSQTYSDWSQIPIPVGRHNPGLLLEFRRFVTESYRKFQKLQLDALRPHLRPGVWVTHNFMGWYDGYDHYVLSADLDMASWDWYVATGHHDYLTSGAAHDLIRGFKGRNFWLMETQPGSVNWSSVNNSLHKGEARAMAWQAVAHGADAVLYWQWRSALGGQEQYHGTLVDQSGQPRPIYEEVKQLAHDFTIASPLLAGSEPAARVALINSYDSRWSVQWQRHHRDFDYVAHLKHYYRPFAALNVPADIISIDVPLRRYKMVVAPALLIVNDEQAQRFEDFVKRGGHLVLTARCGMKDEHNALLPSRQPGPLAELAGVQVEEYYALAEPAPVIGNWFTGVSRLWAERLTLLEDADAQVIARYGAFDGWLDDQVAITVRGYGSGLVYYVGAYLDDEAQQALIAHMTPFAGARADMEAPAGVEVRRRSSADGPTVYIVINHERAQRSIDLPWPAHEHLTDSSLEESLELGPYEVALLTRSP